MTQLIINVGASANDGLGDPLRTSFTYCNSNFSELFSRVQTTPPATLIGVPGDQAGMYAYDATYFYYCFANFDGVTSIWNKALTISEPGNYGNANVAAYLNGSAGNIVPVSNGVQNLGNVARPFKDVFLSNSTITLNSIPVTVVGTDLVVNGDNVVVESSVDNSISVTGNITGNYFIGNGSQLTGIGAGNYSNANVAAYLPTYTGNISALAISTTGNISVGANLQVGSAANLAFSMLGSDCRVISRTSGGNINFFANVAGTVGLQFRISGDGSGVSATGNVSGNYFLGNGSLLTGITANYSNANVAAYLPTYSGNITANVISAAGNVTANNFIGGGAGTPTLSSATNLDLSAATAVRVTGGGTFRLPSLSAAQIANIVAANGDMIYNTTSSKIQGFENGAWGNLI
jgi:hypothetical protein